jgi:hypothetical protein
MNQTSGVLRATVRCVRWGLPWLSVLAISTSVAYSLTVAVAGAPSASYERTTITAPQPPAQALLTPERAGSVTTPGAIDCFVSIETCDTTGGRMLYVGLNSWIPAESAAAPCAHGGS